MYEYFHIRTEQCLIYRNELTRFLHSLDIYFSRRKWQQIFRQMVCVWLHISLLYSFHPNKYFNLMQDKNQEFDKLISLTEFCMFIFPESSSALETETKRIQKLKEVVRTVHYWRRFRIFFNYLLVTFFTGKA